MATPKHNFQKCSKARANLIGEDLREVPVVERDRRLDPLGLQSCDEVAIVLDALGVLLARPAGKDSRPRDGESAQGGTTGFSLVLTDS